MSVVLVNYVSELSGERPFTTFGKVFVMIAVCDGQEHAPPFSRQSRSCLGMYEVFFVRTGFSSLFVCLEDGTKCKFTPRSPERTACLLCFGQRGSPCVSAGGGTC